MTHSAQASSRSRSARDLDAFDFEFNGALDPAQVHEIATAAFVGRGENLLLVGGAGTGKTVIASAVMDEAGKLGLSSQYLSSPCTASAAQMLVSYGAAYIGSTQDRPGLRDELLNCDLLVVDEAERWMEGAPVAFMLLLGRRIELGKTNILVIPSYGWARLFNQERVPQRYAGPGLDSISYLMGSRPEDRSAWGMCLIRAEDLSLPQQMKLLGIDFTLPESAGWETTAVAPIERLRSPFAKAPVWHTLYTGENSYRDVLRRRCA